MVSVSPHNPDNDQGLPWKRFSMVALYTEFQNDGIRWVFFGSK
jgi:hypothetical protein